MTTTTPISSRSSDNLLSLRSRLTVLSAFALLTVVLGCLLVGELWLELIDLLITDGLVLLAWVLACYGIGAALFAREPEHDPLNTVTRIALGMGTLSLALLGLGLIGLLNFWIAWGLIILGVILAAISLRQFSPTKWLAHPISWSGLLLALAPIAALALVAVSVPPGMLWRDEPAGYDVMEYHLQVPREWFESGHITPLAHNAFSYMPFNVEMHYLLAMHLRNGPWNGMYLAQLMHLAMCVLSIIVVYCAIRPRGALPATLAAILMSVTPWLTMLGSVAYDEGGLLLFGTLAIAWGMRWLDRPTMKYAVLGGVFAGLACGSKLTGVPLIVCGVEIAMLLASRFTRVAFIHASVFVVVALLVFSPWLIRNMIWTGNPVFPEGLALSHGRFDDVQVKRWQQAHSPRPEERPIGARIIKARQQIVTEWRYGFAVLPAGIIALCFVARREARYLAALLLVLALFWIGFTHLQARFFTMSIPIAALCVGHARHRVAGLAASVASVVAALVTLIVLVPRVHHFVGVIHYDDMRAILTSVEVPEDVGQRIFDSTDRIDLVGDASAFWYAIPMSRLRYRTVFDVKTTPDPIEGWLDPAPVGGNRLIVVDPGELRRLSSPQTGYFGIQPPPAAWSERSKPFILNPASESPAQSR